MELIKDGQLFFGCKVDSKMREALAQAKPGDRKYFEGDGDDFLQICIAGEEKWIGKILKSGMNTNEIEDIHRNIASILRRISPTIRIATNAIKIFSATATDVRVVADFETEEPATNTESGPYIDY